MALVSQLNYNSKSVGIASRAYDSYQAPINGSTFNAGSTIIFELNGKRGQYLNPFASFIRFTIANATNDAHLDNSAHCIINRMTIYGPNGAIIEDINDYSVLASIINDLYLPDERTVLSSAGMETADFATTTTSGNVTAITNTSRQGYALTAATEYTFTINPYSTIVGGLAEKFFPIGSLNGSLRIELQIENDARILVRGATTTVTISNVEYITNIIEIDPESQAMIEQANGGEYRMHLNQWHSSTISIPAASTGSLQSLIGASRFASLKGFLVRFLNYTSTGNAYSTSSSVLPCTDIQFIIGNQVLPNKAIDTSDGVSEALSYLRNFWHCNNSNDYLGVLTPARCNNADNTYVTTSSYFNATTAGINTDNINYGKSSVMYSGLNTLNSTSYLNLTLGSARTNAITAVVFAHHDALLSVRDGGASVSF